MAKIHEAITAIMAECPAISKSQKNLQQGFLYRGIDVVMNVFQPLLSKHKVFVVPTVLESNREERQTKSGTNMIYTTLKVKYDFMCDDGSCVSAVVQGEGMDSADKSSNKAMSVAFKYALFQVFCIPTEEMIDPDSETPENTTSKNAPKGTRQSGAKQTEKKQESPDRAFYRSLMIKLCEERGIDVKTFAAEHNINETTTPEQFKNCCEELEKTTKEVKENV